MKISNEQMKILKDFTMQLETIRYSIMDHLFQQTVRDHTEKMISIAQEMLKINQISFDKTELFSLIMIHDLPEITLKHDFTAWELMIDKNLHEVKAKQELETITQLADTHGKWLFDLYTEYENQNTPIARFVKWLDKYESSLHIVPKIIECGETHIRADKEMLTAGDMIVWNTERLIDVTSFETKNFTNARIKQLKPLLQTKQYNTLKASLKNKLNFCTNMK